MKKPFVLLWILAGALVIFSWFYLPTLSRYHDLRMQQEDLDKQLSKLNQDVRAMQEERELLKTDVEYLEKVIRDELGLVKPGEIIYKFVPEPVVSTEPVPQVSALPPMPSAVSVPSALPTAGITVSAKPVLSPKSLPLAAEPEPSYPRKETR